MRCPDKVERWPGIIPDVRHPGGTSENFRPGGMSEATCGGLRMMKINGNNKREWVWGC